MSSAKNSPEATNKVKNAFWELAKMVEFKKTTLKPSTKGKCLLGDSENGKVQRNNPKTIN